MGYSKWRKILTILMIISICFTLFGKISKVFAYEGTPTTVTLYGNDYDIYIDYITQNYDYWFMFYNSSTPDNSSSYPYSTGLYLICSNDEQPKFYYDDFKIRVTVSSSARFYRYSKVSQNSIGRFDFTNVVNSFNNGNFSDVTGTTSLTVNSSSTSINAIFISNFDVKDNNGNVVFYSSSRKAPTLANSISDLEQLNDDGLSVNSWDYSNINFYLLIYDRTLVGTDYDYVLNPAREILINKRSSYYQPSLTSDPDSNCIYFIPWSDTGLQFVKNGMYEIRFGIKKYYDERRRSEAEGEDGRGGASEDPTPTEFVDPEDNYSDADSSGTGAGGGFSSRPYYFEIIGINYVFQIDSNISQIKLDQINNSVILTDEQRRHYETISLLEEILDGTTGVQQDILIRSGILSENNQDITSDGFNGIFTRLYNSINTTPAKVSLTIPFTNTPMEIDPLSTYDGIGENNIILNFYQISIFAAVSLFILKDIAKIIQDIKTGDIATKTDTNIKANML